MAVRSFRVKPGMAYGFNKQYKQGSIVMLEESDGYAAPDILEEVGPSIVSAAYPPSETAKEPEPVEITHPSMPSETVVEAVAKKPVEKKKRKTTRKAGK